MRDGASEQASGLYRWTLWSGHHQRAVIGTCLLVVAVLGGFVPRFFDTVQSVSYDIPGSESAQAREAFGRHAGFVERDLLVLSTADGGSDRAGLRRALATIRPAVARVEGVAGVTAPQDASRDGTTSYATVLIAPGVEDRQELAEHLQDVVDAAAPRGVRADLTGTSPVLADMIHVEEQDLSKGEALGLSVALVILVFACGSLVAAFVPIAVASLGLVACLGLLGATSSLVGWGAFIESLVALLGLGVGIDYALLLIRRYREERGRDGVPDAIAMSRTVATAGRTVVFSGATVMVCLPSLLLLGEPLFRQMAVAGMLVVALMIVLAITLVPAVLLALGDRIDAVPAPGRRRRERARAMAAGGIAGPRGDGAWGRWARRVMRRPTAFLLLALVVLGALAWPALGARLGVDYGVRALQDEPSGRALTQLAAHLPEAASLAPIDVAITGGTTSARAQTSRALFRVLSRDPRIGEAQTLATPDDGRSGAAGAEPAAARPGRPSASAGTAATLVVAQARVPVDDTRSSRLVDDLRARVEAAPGTRVLVGGTAAEARDYSRRMADAAPGVIALTLALSFLLLLWMFRSVLIPLKALLCNLLSVGAAYGLLVLVFQDGHGEGLLDFTSPGYLQSWLPLSLFVFIFGLSMDYEVFMVSRVREEWLRTGDNTEAVARGLGRTGGVVSAAATIMVAVFLAFMLTATVPEIKQFAFGLGAAVLIDATLVRGVLVPATMRLAGRWNWWLPRPLTRLLPDAPSH